LLGDQFSFHAVRRQAIEHAIIGLWIDTPEAGVAGVGDSGAELESEQIENTEDGATCKIAVAR
jgi:hypothetical protein